ncbi:MAG: hypothetical protein IJN25_08555 [Clostridia bacterium]|nr:hypothetical protein [Clostridia bacterium]
MKNAKKFFSLAMVLLMVLSLAPAAVYAETTGNLLQNGGFETAEEHVATGWDYSAQVPTHLASKAGTNAFIVKKGDEGAQVHSGNNALKLVSGNDGDATTGRWISQKVTGLTPGKAYRASVWVYIDGTLESGKGLSLRIADSKGTSASVGFSSSNGANRGHGVLLETTGGVWKKLNCAFIPSVVTSVVENEVVVTYDATFAYICLDFGRNATTAVDVYIDDMVFEEISGINGDFEDTEYTVVDDAESKAWATGWSTSNGLNGYQTFIGEHAFVAANAGQDGTNALCLTTTEDEARQLHAYVPVTGLKKGHAYKMRCFVKSSIEESEATAWINAINATVPNGNTYNLYETLHKMGWGGSRVVTYDSKTTTANWIELTKVFTAVDTYTFIGLAAKPEKGECIYFDNVTVEETSVCFTDESGISLGETLSAPGAVNAKATVIGAQGDTARILVGVYKTVNGMPCLVNLYISDSITLPAVKYKDVTIENISLAEGQYAKAVVLNSAAGLQPLTEAKTLTVSAS